MQIKRLLRKLSVMHTTKAFVREARSVPDYGIRDTLHGYLYGRWPYLWIGFGTGEHRLLRPLKPVLPVLNLLFRIMLRFPSDNPRFDVSGLKPGKKQGLGLFREATFADTYHAKVIRLDSAKKLVSVNQELQLTNLEHVIPYSLARDLVLRKSNRILLLECPCRVSRSNPCVPTDVCLVMGDPFVSFVAEHHPQKSRLIDRNEAIDVLTAEAGRGHVHHAFFKEAVYGRFFAICNCCACCCGAMQAQRNGIPMLTGSGYVRVVDKTECDGCGTCEKYCPFNAISMEGDLAVVNPHVCMGCGVCKSFCQQNAITLQRDFNRSAPLDLDELIQG
jgi:Pyruvate/2-oxoacid:ferredoxin oxidoreductase delta subunit